MPAAALQEGIYYESKPLPFYALALLSARRGVTADAAADTVASLWSMYTDLKKGLVRDLQVKDHEPVEVPGGDLSVLIGFGPAWFALKEGGREWPASRRFGAPDENKGFISADSGIAFAKGVVDNPAGDAVVAVQFIANTALAVERGIVETWKLLHDLGDAAPLALAAAYTGTQRDDGRSWIDFHDGLSNILQDNREGAIVIDEAETLENGDWTVGGTYMSFMRLGIRLEAWRNLGRRGAPDSISPLSQRDAQEKLVGRDKLDGCPLTNELVPAPGCIGATGDEAKAFHQGDPGAQQLSETLLQSHIRRANHRIDSPTGRVAVHPIFRQGYPYLETFNGLAPVQAGLNFVSFQQSPGTLFAILEAQDWLGGTNFGGGAGLTLIDAYAAGVFLVPPCTDGERFPGAAVLLTAGG